MWCSAAVLRVWQVLWQSNWWAPRIAVRRALRHTVRTWAVEGKNDWQFSNPRIHTADTYMLHCRALLHVIGVIYHRKNIAGICLWHSEGSGLPRKGYQCNISRFIPSPTMLRWARNKSDDYYKNTSVTEMNHRLKIGLMGGVVRNCFSLWFTRCLQYIVIQWI